MGWFKRALKKVVKSPIGKVMDTVTTAFVHPVQTVSAAVSPEKTFKQVKEKHFAQPLSKQIGQTVLATAGYATATVGAGAVASRGLAATATSLIPSTVKGKVAAAIVAPIAIGAVTSRPAETLSAVASVPSGLANVGANAADLIADPSIKNVKTLISENPVIVGGIAAAGALAAGGVIAPAVSGYLTRKEMQEQTAAFERQAAASEALLTAPSGSKLVREKELATSGDIPLTPETQTITTGTTKRRYRRKKPVSPSVKQSVRVMVSNRATSTGVRATKKYLNTIRLLN